MASYVWVKYGGKVGQQLALVVKDQGGPQLLVRKFRANSRRWTGELRCYRSAVIGPASRGDALKLTRGVQP